MQVNPQTVRHIRKRFAEEGLEAALRERPRPGAEPKLDAKGEAFLIALACSLFLVFQPLLGWRQVRVTERRRAEDFAWQMKRLVDEVFPEADVIRVVLDNRNTHTPAALYQTFSPEEARRLTRKLAFHDTPKHGSWWNNRWLNRVEIEISILARQCLNRRLPEVGSVRREVEAWAKARNAAKATVRWRFSTQDARLKLKRLYPN